MNEIKVYEFDTDYPNDIQSGSYYDKNEADKVIADKDAEIAELKVIAKDACLERDDNRKVIDELEDENRRLKRAQWLERAERAKETQFKWAEYCHCDKLYFCNPFGVSTRKNPYRHISRMNIIEWDTFWEKIKNKCLSKAEEYK